MKAIVSNTLSGIASGAFLMTTSALADGAVTSLATVQGVWEGKVQGGGIAGSFDLEMGITDIGATLSVKKLTLSCEYVIGPDATDGVFPAYLVADRNNDCVNDQLSVSLSNAQLSVKLADQWTSAGQLRQTNGPATGERLFPDVSIRGVTMGLPLADLNGVAPAGSTISREGSSRRVVQGLRQLNGTYRQVTVPYTEPDWAAYAQDTIAAYALPNDANDGAMAVLRYYSPSPLTAPTTDSFVEALVDAYGPPDEDNISGGRIAYDWHYGLDGQDASGPALSSCTRRANSSDDGRAVAVLFESLQFFGPNRARDGTGSMRPKLHPKPGCGYSLEYVLLRNDDGTLKDATVTFYDHRALATEMWGEASETLRKVVEQKLAVIDTSQNNQADL